MEIAFSISAKHEQLQNQTFMHRSCSTGLVQQHCVERRADDLAPVFPRSGTLRVQQDPAQQIDHPNDPAELELGTRQHADGAANVRARQAHTPAVAAPVPYGDRVHGEPAAADTLARPHRQRAGVLLRDV